MLPASIARLRVAPRRALAWRGSSGGEKDTPKAYEKLGVGFYRFGWTKAASLFCDGKQVFPKEPANSTLPDKPQNPMTTRFQIVSAGASCVLVLSFSALAKTYSGTRDAADPIGLSRTIVACAAAPIRGGGQIFQIPGADYGSAAIKAVPEPAVAFPGTIDLPALVRWQRG